MDQSTLALLVGSYLLAVGLGLTILWYLGQTRTLRINIPTVVLIALVFLGPLGLAALVILWNRFRSNSLGPPDAPPAP